MLPQLLRATRQPVRHGFRLWARRRPAAAQERTSRLSARHGFDQSVLVLSFDCDTVRDISAAAEVHERVRALGIQPAYAVPGELLRRGADVWTALAREGSEFLNHGGAVHAEYDEDSGTVRPTLFYDQLSPSDWARDVREGHAAVREVIGAAPAGFRTPHFGTFQDERHLRALHALLAELDYRYSSSTLPEQAMRFGPVHRRYGLPEVPVTGRPSAPLDVLDSWSFFAEPGRAVGPQEFLGEAQRLAADAARRPLVLNLYADPFHVNGSEVFFEALEALVRAARPATFAEVLDGAA